MEEGRENLMSQAEFARKHGMSRKTVTIWKGEGRLVMAGEKVNAAASEAKLRDQGRLNGNGSELDPYAFAAGIVDPLQRLSVVRSLTIAYEAPAVAALSAFEVGCPVKDCWLIYNQLCVSLMEWTVERLTRWECEPFRSNPEAPVLFPGACKEPNWRTMAAERGEAFTPEAWRSEGTHGARN